MQRQTLFPPLIIRTALTTTSTSQRPSFPSDTAVARAGTSGSAPRFLNEGWTIALLVLTSVRLLLLLSLWVYLTRRTLAIRVPLRRVWLTQALLASLTASHGVLFAFVVHPTVASCALVRLGVGLAYATPFAILMLKLVLITAKHKGYIIPVFCQILLLLLLVCVQMALSIQWLLLVPSTITSSDRTSCGPGVFDWLPHLSYVCLLLMSGTVLAAVNHRVKSNRREAAFLGLSFGLNIPVWIVWVTTAALLRHKSSAVQDECLAFGLWTSTSLVLFIMFLPKSRQLVAIGESGLYTEDAPVVKPISELTVHKLYYPVYPDRRTSVGGGGPGTTGRSSVIDDGGSDILDREEVPSIPRVNAHWYPPLREPSGQGSARSLRGSTYANRMSRPYYYPAAPSPSVRFDDALTNIHRVRVSNGQGRCLTPPSEEGSTTPSVQESERMSNNDDSDLDMSNFRERNVDGVSYTQVSRQQPMY